VVRATSFIDGDNGCCGGHGSSVVMAGFISSVTIHINSCSWVPAVVVNARVREVSSWEIPNVCCIKSIPRFEGVEAR
jgi:hypothetical protein